MSLSLTDAKVVFEDLQDACRVLEEVRGSPKEVRRAFTRLVELSQKLTAAMRTDFSRLTGKRWEASSFNGWTTDTDFLKWVRNEDQHANQIYISVQQRNFYRLNAASDDLIVVEGTWVLVDQLSAENPDSVSLRLPDPLTGGISDAAIEPVRIEYEYLFQPRTAEAQEWLLKIGDPDVHPLASRVCPVFGSYFEYFSSQVAANTSSN